MCGCAAGFPVWHWTTSRGRPVQVLWQDGDGFGDRPYELLAYADRIWLETPAARFFRNSPVLELLDFLEKLAPFSTPSLILRDTAPRMQPARGYN